MSVLRSKRPFLLAIVALATLAISPAALAHEGREVGELNFVVGFAEEPALEGQPNAVFLRVTAKGYDGMSGDIDDEAHENEGDEDQGREGGDGHAAESPVEGLEDSLQVEVTHLGSNSSTTLQLTPRFGEPGAYESVLIPTSPGKYRFRFFGEIRGEPVDEAFESGVGRFDEVVAAADVQFPLKVASLRELEGVTRSARDAAVSANDDAGLSSTLAIIAIVVGAIGVVTGTAGLAAAMRIRSRN